MDTHYINIRWYYSTHSYDFPTSFYSVAISSLLSCSNAHTTSGASGGWDDRTGVSVVRDLSMVLRITEKHQDIGANINYRGWGQLHIVG